MDFFVVAIEKLEACARIRGERFAQAVSTQPQTDRTFCSAAIDDVSVLGDDDLSLLDEVVCGCARGSHQRLPVGCGGACGFAGADSFAFAAIVEQAEDGGFELVLRGDGGFLRGWSSGRRKPENSLFYT